MSENTVPGLVISDFTRATARKSSDAEERGIPIPRISTSPEYLSPLAGSAPSVLYDPWSGFQSEECENSTYSSLYSPKGSSPRSVSSDTYVYERFREELGKDMGSSVEHPLGEHPSRTLFVRNLNSSTTEEELRKIFEEYGEVRSMYTQCKHRGFVMISYYDIRHAKSAMRSLQGRMIRKRKIDIHYSIPKENPSERDQNQGTLVVFNLDPTITNEELVTLFGQFGEIKEIRETPHKKHHKFVEFYDVRDAEKAMKVLNKSEVKGKKIKIEPSRPGGVRKGLLQTLSLDSVEDPKSVQIAMKSLSNSPSSNAYFNGSSSPVNTEEVTRSNSLPERGSYLSKVEMPAYSMEGLSDGIQTLNVNGYDRKGPSPTNGNEQDLDIQREFSHNSLFSGSSSPTGENMPGSPTRSPLNSAMERNEDYASFSLDSNHRQFYDTKPSISISSVGKGLGESAVEAEKPPPPYERSLFSQNVLPQSHPNSYMGANSYYSNVPPSGTPMVPPNVPSHGMANESYLRQYHQENTMYGGHPDMQYPPQRPQFPPPQPQQPLPYNPYMSGREYMQPYGPPPVQYSYSYPSENSFQPPPNSYVPPYHVSGNGEQPMYQSFLPVPQPGYQTVSNVHSGNSSATPSPSASPRTTGSVSPYGHLVAASPSRSPAHSPRSPRRKEEEKAMFVFNIDRVRRGDDTRTTLMIKNIPNKYTQKMLLEKVDEKFRGMYDFFYLPIDFKNKCNVGYAFVNFISTEPIVDFYEEFNGKKWERFNSEKVCEIAYARIQGKQALIAHFQNSSLLSEDKKCRPILFYSDGPMKGELEAFPGTNSPPRRKSNEDMY